MAILVALKPGQSNAPALTLAAELAQVLGETVLAAAVVVVPQGVPSPLRVGMTDEDFVALIAVDVMAEARTILGDALEAELPVRARSVRAGLLDVITEQVATHLVLGSSTTAGGAPGRMVLGDVGAALLHAASVPVHLAPVAYGGGNSAHPVRRVTVAFGPDDASREALRWGAELALRVDGLLRTATFFVRSTSGIPPVGGAGYAGELAAAWHEQMERAVKAAIRGLQDQGVPTMFIDTVAADGQDWASAMAAVDWEPGDLLVIGSRPRSGIRSVFLGSRAAEILHHATVPVTVLPG